MPDLVVFLRDSIKIIKVDQALKVGVVFSPIIQPYGSALGLEPLVYHVGFYANLHFNYAEDYYANRAYNL